VRPGGYPREEHLKDAALAGLPANFRLSRKGLPGTNILAYYKKGITYDCKKFYNISF
jgi:hypothetical protein